MRILSIDTFIYVPTGRADRKLRALRHRATHTGATPPCFTVRYFFREGPAEPEGFCSFAVGAARRVAHVSCRGVDAAAGRDASVDVRTEE